MDAATGESVPPALQGVTLERRVGEEEGVTCGRIGRQLVSERDGGRGAESDRGGGGEGG